MLWRLNFFLSRFTLLWLEISLLLLFKTLLLEFGRLTIDRAYFTLTIFYLKRARERWSHTKLKKLLGTLLRLLGFLVKKDLFRESCAPLHVLFRTCILSLPSLFYSNLGLLLLFLTIIGLSLLLQLDFYFHALHYSRMCIEKRSFSTHISPINALWAFIWWSTGGTSLKIRNFKRNRAHHQRWCAPRAKKSFAFLCDTYAHTYATIRS